MTGTDRAILAAADLPRWRREEIAAGLGMTSPQLHQRLNALLDDPDAMAAMPQQVARLRRIRDRRRSARAIG